LLRGLALFFQQLGRAETFIRKAAGKQLVRDVSVPIESLRLKVRRVRSAYPRTFVPPYRRANSQLNSAVRAPPTWRYPVGDGANRTRGPSIPRILTCDEQLVVAPCRAICQHGYGAR
jgi:hypothetical protein